LYCLGQTLALKKANLNRKSELSLLLAYFADRFYLPKLNFSKSVFKLRAKQNLNFAEKLIFENCNRNSCLLKTQTELRNFAQFRLRYELKNFWLENFAEANLEKAMAKSGLLCEKLQQELTAAKQDCFDLSCQKRIFYNLSAQAERFRIHNPQPRLAANRYQQSHY